MSGGPDDSFTKNTMNSEIEDSEQEMPSSCVPHPSNEGNEEGTISVQLLEFKTRLLEAVTELHIYRDGEIRFEEQINKLVLEKQELEWQKESLQHHIDTLTNQHTESVASIKNQFQARIREMEGEKCYSAATDPLSSTLELKGKYQLTAELKDKEISSLKEEVKSLQLSKCSLQKTLNELEKKLHLQMQTKDSHLRLLSEVERRFGVVSRQFAAVREAYEKLEQKVGEAVRLNKNLSSLNKKQEATIICLKQDVDKLNYELIKSKVLSVCKSDEECLSCPVKDQQKKLQHSLHVQTKINKNLSEEISAIRAEKQEVMNSLQQAQRLLQMQTKAVGRVELELSMQREEYQALKREHAVLQAKTREGEDRFVRLTEEYKNSKAKQEKQNDKELVQLCCPARTKQDLSDSDKTQDAGHAPDEGKVPAPTELRETVTDGLPQPDYGTAIEAHRTRVYVAADMEGTVKGDCEVDLTDTALKPPESPSAMAVFSAGVAPSADTADTLGVCGTRAGQQVPDSQVVQPCMNMRQPGNCTLNEAHISSSPAACKYDSIKEMKTMPLTPWTMNKK